MVLWADPGLNNLVISALRFQLVTALPLWQGWEWGDKARWFMAGISPCTCVHTWSMQQASLHNLLPSLTTSAVKNFLLITNLNLPFFFFFFSLNLLSLVLLADKESFPIFLVGPLQVMDESLLHGLKYCIPSMMCSYFSLKHSVVPQLGAGIWCPV